VCSLEEAKQVELFAWIGYWTLGLIWPELLPWILIWTIDIVVMQRFFSNGWVKNAYNAIGFFSLLSAAGSISGSKTFSLSVYMLPALVFLTIWIQDFRDIEGDAAAGRTTTPMVFGEQRARKIMCFVLVFVAPIFIYSSLFFQRITVIQHIVASVVLSIALGYSSSSPTAEEWTT
jgi:4-hydroxybenzoate polyprenyltransferase